MKAVLKITERKSVRVKHLLWASSKNQKVKFQDKMTDWISSEADIGRILLDTYLNAIAVNFQ